MKKILILFAMMIIFAFSCTWMQRDKDDTDATENDYLLEDSIESDIFEHTDSTFNDSIIF